MAWVWKWALGRETVNKYQKAGVNFQENCVFVDKDNFRFQMMRKNACSNVQLKSKVFEYIQKNMGIIIVGYVDKHDRHIHCDWYLKSTSLSFYSKTN